MTGKTHISLGIAVAAPLITAYSYDIGYLMVTLIGAIAPDIDIALKIKHRTWTHSLLVLFISTIIISRFNESMALFWFVGFSTHLVADSFTKMGVPFLYPFTDEKFGIKIIKTGGVVDIILRYVAVVIILYFSYKYVLNTGLLLL